MIDTVEKPAVSRSRSKKTSPASKIFVLDTNVLLHDPQALFKFEDNTLALPVEVLEELDRKKSVPGELGFAARKIHRDLRALFERVPAVNGSRAKTAASTLERKLPNGGRLLVLMNEALGPQGADFYQGNGRMALFRSTFSDLDKMDNRILATVIHLAETHPKTRVILVTKDANMALKGIALGLEVQDYMNDKVARANISQGYKTVEVDETTFEQFVKENITSVEPSSVDHLQINEYVYLRSGSYCEPARFFGDGQFDSLLVPKRSPGIKIPKGIRIQALNDEQRILMDALLDEDIKLVTCRGKAGTGKTLVTIAMALYQTLGEEAAYERIFITRPLVHIGKDTGALPGNLNEKLAPYIAPFYDNLEVLFSNRKIVAGDPVLEEMERVSRITSNRKRKKYASKLARQFPGGNAPEQGSFPEITNSRKPYQFLFDYGKVEVEAMTFIRGRSLANTFFIIDEAQNMTPHEAKTVVSRMGEGSKVVLLGDPGQVDSMFLDAATNGLVHTAQRLKGQKITAHVELTQGVRSELAELAADHL